MQLSDGIRAPSEDEAYEEGRDRYISLFAAMTLKCLELDTNLRTWYALLESQNQHHYQGRLFSWQPSTLYARLDESSPVRNLPFEFFLCFPNADIAQQVVLYWTGMLLTRSTFWLAKGRLLRAGYDPALIPSPQFSTLQEAITPVPFAPAASVAAQASAPQALLIAQSLEYFVHPDMGFMGASFIGFPMAVAQSALRHVDAPELAWFDVIFGRMRHMRSGVGSFLKGMANEFEDPQPSLLQA